MGCGASKSSGQVVAVPQGKAKQDSSIPAQQAAAPAKAVDQAGFQDVPAKKDDEVVLVKQRSEKPCCGNGTADPSGCDASKLADAEKAMSVEDKPPVSVTVVASTAQDSADPERRTSAQAEDRAKAAFRAQFQGLVPTDGSPAPADGSPAPADGSPAPAPSITFKSSRSLNRSIGVRRRGSDSDTQDESGGDVAAMAAAVVGSIGRSDPEDEEEVTNSPDSVVERFERTKNANPLLRNALANSHSSNTGGKPSEKACKSQKRLAVGFALEGADKDEDAEEADAADGTVDVTVDPERAAAAAAAQQALERPSGSG